MSEFHDNYPSYEHLAAHSEEVGKTTRVKLWRVFWIMLAITIFELIIGFMAPNYGWTGTAWLKVLFITLTVVKAGYIVMSFMHLSHEVRFMKWAILLPYAIFMVYTIFIVLDEGVYSGYKINRTHVDPLYIKQQEDLRLNHGKHSSHDATPHSNTNDTEHKH